MCSRRIHENFAKLERVNAEPCSIITLMNRTESKGPLIVKDGPHRILSTSSGTCGTFEYTSTEYGAVVIEEKEENEAEHLAAGFGTSNNCHRP